MQKLHWSFPYTIASGSTLQEIVSNSINIPANGFRKLIFITFDFFSSEIYNETSIFLKNTLVLTYKLIYALASFFPIKKETKVINIPINKK